MSGTPPGLALFVAPIRRVVAVDLGVVICADFGHVLFGLLVVGCHFGFLFCWRSRDRIRERDELGEVSHRDLDLRCW